MTAAPVPPPYATAPLPPPPAAAVFGPALDRARQYADLLAGVGVQRGLLGPREVDRIWQRHLLNCAAVAELIDRDTTVVDVGSGAGLPGIVVALARPDLTVVLVEPLLRRSRFLTECVAQLELGRVTVVRERAEAIRGLTAPTVTARAVAPLARLTGWCWPLVQPGGQLLAIKGANADQELERDRRALPSDVRDIGVLRCGESAAPTIVIRLSRRRRQSR